MTEAIAFRTADLPNIAGAALPATYEQARAALVRCDRLDECKTWADKAAALASYAKQADDPTLHRLATRISARAIRRCGELLKTFQNPGARTDKPPDGGGGRSTQRQAAAGAGMSERQELTAVRVANVPAAEFEALVESDRPPSLTTLAEMGTVKQAPTGFVEATQAIDRVRQFALFCEVHPPAFIAGGIYGYEVAAVRADVAAITTWLEAFVADLDEGAT